MNKEADHELLVQWYGLPHHLDITDYLVVFAYKFTYTIVKLLITSLFGFNIPNHLERSPITSSSAVQGIMENTGLKKPFHTRIFSICNILILISLTVQEVLTVCKHIFQMHTCMYANRNLTPVCFIHEIVNFYYKNTKLTLNITDKGQLSLS